MFNVATRGSSATNDDIARTVLWVGFGVLWLIDGILQTQPAKFTNVFLEEVLLPAAQGQPGWLGPVLQFGAAAWQVSPKLANTGAIAVQMAIGWLLIIGRNRLEGRIGLAVSICWGLSIWIFGEGLGGILVGAPSILTGAPGPVLLYILGAIFLLVPSRFLPGGDLQVTLSKGLGLFWLIMAVLQAWPSAGYWRGTQLATVFSEAASVPQPYLLALPSQVLTIVTYIAPALVNGCIVAVLGALAFAYLWRDGPQWALPATAGWLLFLWWVPQSFGGIFSDLATDPDTALPLLVLLLAASVSAVHERVPAQMLPRELWAKRAA